MPCPEKRSRGQPAQSAEQKADAYERKMEAQFDAKHAKTLTAHRAASDDVKRAVTCYRNARLRLAKKYGLGSRRSPRVTILASSLFCIAQYMRNPFAETTGLTVEEAYNSVCVCMCVW